MINAERSSDMMYKIITENWHKFMADEPFTKEEFDKETYQGQVKFFRWFQSQHNDTFTIGI